MCALVTFSVCTLLTTIATASGSVQKRGQCQCVSVMTVVTMDIIMLDGNPPLWGAISMQTFSGSPERVQCSRQINN